MASKQRKARNSKPKVDNTLAQFGIFDVPDLNNMDEDDDSGGDDDEGTLENELQAILSGKAPTTRQPRKAPAANVTDVEKMAAACMREMSIDEDENLSGDENLLSELHALVPEASKPAIPQVTLISPIKPQQEPSPMTQETSIVEVLSERLNLYKEAEVAAKACGDSSKSRRYGRAAKTLESLLKAAKAGNAINEEDIPPPVVIPKPKPKPPPVSDDILQPESESKPAEKPPSTPPPSPPRQAEKSSLPNLNDALGGNSPIGTQLANRRDQYKMAALQAKKAGDVDTALKYVRIAKKFDAVIEAEKSGNAVDLSNMPPPPPGFGGNVEVQSLDKPEPVKTEAEHMQNSPASSAFMDAALAAASEPQEGNLFDIPTAPTTILEALEQRLQKYVSTRDAAKGEGNNSKARRLHRIVQQYEVAIKDHKAGKPVTYDELPAPPGFAPIPTEGSAPEGATPPKVPARKPQVPQTPKSAAPAPPVPPRREKSVTPDTKGSSSGKGKLQRSNTSTILEKQLNFLLERQKLFRQAALESKKNGDIQQAKEYLRMSKGFDSMIEASRCGLPIDATSIPTPPQLESDFVIIDQSACSDEFTTNGLPDVYSNLEKDLKHQIEVCEQNKEHFLRLGDVNSASKFEKLALTCKKDLSVVQYAWQDNQSIPRFHYENRLFSMVQCHTDLGDNDMEIVVERGINLPGKSDDLDSYVRFELPLPPDAPQRGKTRIVRDTNNPVFQEDFKFEFNRKSRSILRHFKRQNVKLEVWSKGGFLRGDTLLGTVNVKLVDLESKCTVHDSFDLMDGRKACGGKLEVKIRIRDPLLVKQVEEVKEKWLIIGS